MVAIENRKHGDFGRLCIALLVLLGTVDAEDHSIGYTGICTADEMKMEPGNGAQCDVDQLPKCDSTAADGKFQREKCPRMCRVCKVQCDTPDPATCSKATKGDCKTTTLVFKQCPQLCDQCATTTTSTRTTDTTATTTTTTATTTTVTTIFDPCVDVDTFNEDCKETELKSCDSKFTLASCPVLCGVCKVDCPDADKDWCADTPMDECLTNLLTRKSCPEKCGDCKSTSTTTVTTTTITTTTKVRVCEGQDAPACWGKSTQDNCDKLGYQTECPQLCQVCFVKCGSEPDPACASISRDKCSTDRLINRQCPEKCGQCLNSCGDEPDASSCTELSAADCVGDSPTALQTKIKCPGLCNVCKAVKDSSVNVGKVPKKKTQDDIDNDAIAVQIAAITANQEKCEAFRLAAKSTTAASKASLLKGVRDEDDSADDSAYDYEASDDYEVTDLLKGVRDEDDSADDSAYDYEAGVDAVEAIQCALDCATNHPTDVVAQEKCYMDCARRARRGAHMGSVVSGSGSSGSSKSSSSGMSEMGFGSASSGSGSNPLPQVHDANADADADAGDDSEANDFCTLADGAVKALITKCEKKSSNVKACKEVTVLAARIEASNKDEDGTSTASTKSNSTGIIMGAICAVVLLVIIVAIWVVKTQNTNGDPAFVVERGRRGGSRRGPAPPFNPSFEMPVASAPTVSQTKERRNTIQSVPSSSFEEFGGFGDESITEAETADGNSWDWRGKTTKEAEGALSDCSGGSFIIRDSSSAAATLCIVHPADGTIYRRQIETVFSPEGPRFALKTSGGGDDDSQQFISIEALIKQYQSSQKSAKAAKLPCKIRVMDATA